MKQTIQELLIAMVVMTAIGLVVIPKNKAALEADAIALGHAKSAPGEVIATR